MEENYFYQIIREFSKLLFKFMKGNTLTREGLLKKG
jgi:hypothetical protein